MIKAQSAIEYLMTYGWMLLVVALVGGLLFTLFQDQELESNSVEGFEDSGIQISEASVSSNGLSVELLSREPERVEDIEVCVYNSTISSCQTVNSLDIGEEGVLSLTGFSESIESFEYSMNVSYSDESGLSFVEKGSVTLQAVYGSSSSIEVPGVEVLEPVGVNSSNATLRGNVTSLGGASSVDVSFNVTSNSSIGVKDAGSVSNVGVFSYDLTGLESGTEYNYTARAENSADQAGSNKQNFTTNALIIDNFEDGDISEYTQGGEDSNAWSVSSSKKYSGNYGLNAYSDNGDRTGIVSTSGLYNYPSRGENFTFYHRRNKDEDTGFFWAVQSESLNTGGVISDGYHIAFKEEAEILLLNYSGGSGNILDTYSHDLESNEWHRVEINWKNDQIDVHVYNSADTEVASVSAQNGAYNQGGIGFRQNPTPGDQSMKSSWDYVKIN